MASPVSLIAVTRQPLRSMLRLRSWQAAPEENGKGPRLLGEPLPGHVGKSRTGELRVLCTAPGDWLMISASMDAASILQSIEAECRTEGMVAIDVSQGFATLRVEGVAAALVLSSGCGLDLRFIEGKVARTRLASIAVVIEPLEHSAGFDLHVARSHARYLAERLADAAVPFQDERG